jgi:hypothetical protein
MIEKEHQAISGYGLESDTRSARFACPKEDSMMLWRVEERMKTDDLDE